MSAASNSPPPPTAADQQHHDINAIVAELLRAERARTAEEIDRRVAAAVSSALTDSERDLFAANGRIGQLSAELDDERRAAPVRPRVSVRFAQQPMSPMTPAREAVHPNPNITAPTTTVTAAPKALNIRYNIPPYSAIPKKDRILARQWLFAMWTQFAIHGIKYLDDNDAERAIMYTAANFAPDVAEWYHNEYASIPKPSVITYKFFIDCMMAKFEPVPSAFTARTALKSLTQTGSIIEYNAAFGQVITQISDMAEADKVDKYIDGLKPGLRTKVAGTLTETLLATMTIAVQLDAAWAHTREHNRPQHFYNNRNRQYPPTTGSANVPSPMQLGQVATSYDDDGQDDEGKSSASSSLAAMQYSRPPLPKLTDALKAELMSAGKCYRCRQKGHIARNCTMFEKSKNE